MVVVAVSSKCLQFKSVVVVLMGLGWLLACPGLSYAQERTFKYAGPTELQDTFLPSQLRYQAYPESARTLPETGWSTNLTVDYSVHLAKTDTYLFDGESVTNTLKIRHSTAAKWEFGLDLPYTWRIDGVLDEFIEFVELTLNQRVEERLELPRDTYQAFVGTTEQELVLTRGGGLGDIVLRAKYQFLDSEVKGWDGSVVGTFTLPTGESTFGGEGVSPSLGLHLQRPMAFDFLSLRGINGFGGAAVVYHSDARTQKFDLNHWRAMGYWGVELQAAKYFSLVGVHQIYSSFAPKHAPLDEVVHYWSVGGRFWIREGFMFQVDLVENSWFGRLENRHSSDVTFKFSLTGRY